MSESNLKLVDENNSIIASKMGVSPRKLKIKNDIIGIGLKMVKFKLNDAPLKNQFHESIFELKVRRNNKKSIKL